jgi:hypothetical protein
MQSIGVANGPEAVRKNENVVLPCWALTRRVSAHNCEYLTSRLYVSAVTWYVIGALKAPIPCQVTVLKTAGKPFVKMKKGGSIGNGPLILSAVVREQFWSVHTFCTGMYGEHFCGNFRFLTVVVTMRTDDLWGLPWAKYQVTVKKLSAVTHSRLSSVSPR